MSGTRAGTRLIAASLPGLGRGLAGGRRGDACLDALHDRFGAQVGVADAGPAQARIEFGEGRFDLRVARLVSRVAGVACFARSAASSAVRSAPSPARVAPRLPARAARFRWRGWCRVGGADDAGRSPTASLLRRTATRSSSRRPCAFSSRAFDQHDRGRHVPRERRGRRRAGASTLGLRVAGSTATVRRGVPSWSGGARNASSSAPAVQPRVGLGISCRPRVAPGRRERFADSGDLFARG